MNPFPNLEKQVQETLALLAEETDAVRQSTFFKEYLDTMARFWHYSYKNQLLIFVQNKDASNVAGYRTWQELGRCVRKGEKAIKILAPTHKKIIKKDAVTGEEKEIKETYFFPVNVFDVSQTEGKPLPKISMNVNGDDKKELLDKLLAFCSKQNITVEFKELGVNGLYGYSQGGKIVIGNNQNVNTQVNTLIHEIAHELTHYSAEGKKFSKQEKEIQAEATTYVVTKVLGLENKSAQYLAMYAKEKEKIMDNIEVISKVTKEILKQINCNELQ
jgi:antirestriction protein ArdC